MNRYPLLNSLKYKKQLTVGLITAVLLFILNYHVMKNLPGHRNFACVMGAALTPFNITFAVVTSLLTGLIVAGMMELFHIKRKNNVEAAKAGSASILGILVGFFTVFCAACTLPFITLFGFAISLTFLTEYDIPLKIISLTLIAFSIYLLSKQLKGECGRCQK